MSKVDRDRIIFEGKVLDSNKGKFKVGYLRSEDGTDLDESVSILCSLSGKIRMNSVKILLGDLVRIEVGQYDMTQGRIIYRIKGN